jgi:putative ABC transport system permease protein
VRQLRLFLRSIFQRKRVDRELEEEMRHHLDLQIEDGIARGLTPEKAEYAARRAMGATTQNMESCRDARRVNFLDDLSRDLRYSLRTMRKDPGFALLSVSIMALGIGANTAVFSAVNTVLLKPLAFQDPDRIVSLTYAEGQGAAYIGQIAIPDFEDWHSQNSSLEALAYYGSREVPAAVDGAAEYAQAAQVGPEFFNVFHVQPVVGRFFSDTETRPGDNGAVVISNTYWHRHFAGDTNALGKIVTIYGRALPIIGVLPAGFAFPAKTELWTPARISPSDRQSRLSQNWLAIGRLKPGVPIEQARTEMASISGRLEQQYPESNKGRRVGLTLIRDRLVGDSRGTLMLLLGTVAVVLLIACANTATLLLGRASARTREVAVRATLGASRSRILRQLITESLLLSLLAGALGLALAYGGTKILIALAPADFPRLGQTEIDGTVLAFTLAISILTSVLFGLVPALHTAKLDLNQALKAAAGRTLVAGGSFRMRGALVIAETALAVVLLSGAGLLIRSFAALNHVDLGFRPENVLAMRATVPVRMQSEAATRFFQELLPKTAELPGVIAAGATMAPPGHVESSGAYFIDHLPDKPDWTSAPGVVLSVVSPRTFAALGIPLKSGRDFDDADTPDQPLVAIVNEALVRKSFPGQDPIGRTVFCPYDNLKGMTIVGVVGNVRQAGPGNDVMPECYMTYRQHGFNGNTLSIVARTTGNPVALEQTLRRLVSETSPDVPVKFTTMEAVLSENIAAPRFRMILLGAFAALAISLAMAGVYGVMAFAVGQRFNEIGLRMALGATSGAVLRLILLQGLRLSCIGLFLGLVIAFSSAKLLTSMLFQIKPTDLLVYLGVTGLLAAVAFLASYIPARRASKIDPLIAIRQE